MRKQLKDVKKSNLSNQIGIVTYDSAAKKILSNTNSIEFITKDRNTIPGSTPNIEETITTSTTTTTTTITTSTTTTTTTLPPTNFISTWRTTTSSESITLPYNNAGTYSGTIDWGDGTTSTNSYANRTHTYAISGDYTITISGTINGWSFGLTVSEPERTKIRSITQWGSSFRLGNQGKYFERCTNLNLSGVIDILNLTGTTTLNDMFYGCTSLTTIGRMNEWDISSVTNMAYIFGSANSFNQDISNWNVSSVTNMYQMFSSATLFNQDISGWDVSNVMNMAGTFSGCSINQDISNWDVSSVTNMNYMFFGTPFNQNISSWNVSSVTDMGSMFYNASAFNQPIGNWNVANVTDMSSMFASATSFNQNLSGWCVTNIPSTPTSFAIGASAWVLSKPIWGTCPTTTTTSTTTTTTTV